MKRIPYLKRGDQNAVLWKDRDAGRSWLPRGKLARAAWLPPLRPVILPTAARQGVLLPLFVLIRLATVDVVRTERKSKYVEHKKIPKYASVYTVVEQRSFNGRTLELESVKNTRHDNDDDTILIPVTSSRCTRHTWTGTIRVDKRGGEKRDRAEGSSDERERRKSRWSRWHWLLWRQGAWHTPGPGLVKRTISLGNRGRLSNRIREKRAQKTKHRTRWPGHCAGTEATPQPRSPATPSPLVARLTLSLSLSSTLVPRLYLSLSLSLFASPSPSSKFNFSL